MKMNVGDDRHVRPFADLFHCRRSIVVRHGDPDDLASGLDHFLDLPNRASTSVVSVLVIDWTTTGAPPPIWMSRTFTAFVTRFILILRLAFLPGLHYCPTNLETSKKITVTINSNTIARPVSWIRSLRDHRKRSSEP